MLSVLTRAENVLPCHHGLLVHRCMTETRDCLESEATEPVQEWVQGYGGQINLNVEFLKQGDRQAFQQLHIRFVDPLDASLVCLLRMSNVLNSGAEIKRNIILPQETDQVVAVGALCPLLQPHRCNFIGDA